VLYLLFFFSSRRRHTRFSRDWSSDVCSSDLWNLATWKLGIPSSSSHTLIGGFMGAALAHAFTIEGADLNTVVNYAKVIPIILFIFCAPLIGMFVAYLLTIIILNVCRKANPSKADKWFKRLQLVSSALFSLGHGANDAQKVM